jgi:anti-anti-sigma regulatory factor
MREGWDLIKVVGDIRPIDVPSLAMASRHAFRRRPPRLVVDLTDVAECDTAGIRWLRAVGNRIVSCGGEFRVAAVVAKPLGRLLQSSGIEVHDQPET